MSTNSMTTINENHSLLKAMVVDQVKQSSFYNPGPYWEAKSKNTLREMTNHGINDFRGTTNLVGMSYTDNLPIDIRNLYVSGAKRLICNFLRLYPMNKIFESQLN